ncbi:MAG: M20 family metallo-hydrolase [Synergistaceae bacterium]|jgi:succinyl-diaminopimelate desuccinylase|nr:M20 family metallo-hydrolase [Synergistaceae bacterium]
MKDLLAKIKPEITRLKDDMAAALVRICSIPAVSPHNGGTGEEEKARAIEALVSDLGLGAVAWHRVDDAASPTGNRPSLFLEHKGRKARRLCILSHVDVVPDGDRSLWSVDPWKPVIRGDRVYGRGVSDNGTALVSSLFALKAVTNLGLPPEFTVLLAFVADEEMGSEYGVKPLIERGLFRSDDLVVVPDSGTSEGDFIEISEKSGLKLEFTVKGKQTHAARPQTGVNACRAANAFSFELDRALHLAFPDEDPLFSPTVSTFEPTRRFANVPNINTIPGLERFAFDCRVLPSVPLDGVLKVVEQVRTDSEKAYGAAIEASVSRSDAAPPTSPDSDVVRLLTPCIKEVIGVEPRLGGIGGGTFAAFFRRKGIPAAVWQQNQDGVAHQPDENTELEHLVHNAEVFALMMTGA